MKKLLIILCFVFSSLFLFAQDMPSISGVDFGTSYSICKEKFDNKFNNGQISEQSKTTTLNYYSTFFAGYYFDIITFGFSNDTTGSSHLCSADFFICYTGTNKAERAKKRRDELFNFYRSKYKFRWSGIDDNGWKYYVLGYDPYNEEDGLIAISIIEFQGDLYVNIGYGPISFISPLDEI